MGKYDKYKKLVLGLNLVKNTVTTSVLGMSGQQVVGGIGNEGIEMVEWINERIDDGSIQAISFPSATNLTYTNTVNTLTVLSDTGTDAILPAVTTSLAGVMTASDKITLNALRTLSGRPVGSNDLGTFTGTIIPDNVTIKDALQALETELDSIPGISSGNLTSTDSQISIIGGTNAVINGGASITLNPSNILLETLGGALQVNQIDGTGATLGDFLVFNGTNYAPFTYTPSIPDHNDLGSIQGGAVNEYYHIDLSLYEQLTDANSNIILGRVSTPGQIQELTLGGSLVFNTTSIQLENDNITPGNLKYYGTDASGVKGWYSGTFTGVTSVSATDSVDIDFTVTNPITTPDITGVLTNTTVTPGTYGAALSIPTFTVNSKGRITGAGNIALSLTSSNISDFSEAVDDRLNSVLVAGTNITLTYDDPSNTLTINSTASIGSGLTNQVAYWTSPTVLGGDADFIFDGTYLSVGTSIPSSLSRFTTKGLGNSLSTFGIVHQSLSGSEVFKVADNGAVQIGALGEIYLHPDAINLSTGTTFPISVIGDLYLNSDKTIIVEGGGIVSSTPSFKSIATRTGTSAQYNAQITGNVTYTVGGTHAYSDLYIDTHINQTLHTGPIRSVYVNPTITTANNYIGIEVNAPGQTALKTTAGDVSFNFGSDATGDLYYRDSSGNLTRLPIGGPTEVLGSTGTVPAWTTTAGSLPGGTNGDVLMYAGGTWVSASPIVEKQTGITGTGITLGATPLGSLLFMLFRNGIYQDETDDYSIMGNAITLVTALVATDKITAIYYT